MSEMSVSLPASRWAGLTPSSLLKGAPVYLWLALLVLLPNLLMIGYSVLAMKSGKLDFHPTFANYQRLAGSQGVWVLLGRTIAVSMLSAALAAVIAYPMALYASRLRRGKELALMLVIIPLWISLLMRVYAWRIILGENGVINSSLISLGLITEPIPALLYSPFAVFLTFAYVALPFVFVSVFTILDRIPRSLIQAANDCGASDLRAFWTIVWPLSRPGLAIGLALGFLIAIGDYVTPAMVGGIDGTMIGSLIATQFGIAGNWSYGSALAVTLLAVVSVLMGLLLWATRIRGSAEGDATGEPIHVLPPEGGAARLRRWLGFLLFCLPYAFLYAPLLMLAVFSFNDSKVQALPLSGWTLDWYRGMADNVPMLAALQHSLIVGLSTLVVSAVAGTAFAVLLVVGRLKFSGTTERLLLLPLALPGVILGITLVLAFQLLQVPPGYFRLVLGHSTFVMPVIMSIVIDRLRRLDPSLIDASMDLGASPVATFFRILLPLVGSAVFGGALLGFTLSVDEVVVSAFLVDHRPTLPVWVWNQTRYGFTPSVNAIFVCIGLATFALVALSRALIVRK